MDRDRVAEWVSAYVEVWRAPGVERLGEVFTEDVSYLPSPWAPPVQGLDALALFWDSARDDGEEFEETSEVVAVDGETAVVRVSVEYLRPRPERWRNLWVLRFAADGRCAAFEEWPFAPRQPDGHQREA